MEDKKLLKEAITLFNSLKIDPTSDLFSEVKSRKIEIFKGCSATKTYKFS